MTADRIALAQSLLQEAVFTSRARQAAGGAISEPAVAADPARPAGSRTEKAAGNCGLGAETVVDLDLSERGKELCGEIWSREVYEEGTNARRDASSEILDQLF